MTVETCHRCRAVTDTDEDHRCPHGEYCQMLDGNTGDCRSYCHVCDDELRDAEVAALRASNAELTCKGEDLCQHHGNALLEMERLRARVAELEAPRSPNALELAERMTHAWLRIHHAERENADLASIEYDAARAALVAYDKRK